MKSGDVMGGGTWVHNTREGIGKSGGVSGAPTGKTGSKVTITGPAASNTGPTIWDRGPRRFPKDIGVITVGRTPVPVMQPPPQVQQGCCC